MAFADADEAARQRFGEQRARNSGWDEMTFDCANPKDARFRDFGILSRNMEAFNPKKLTLATPCVERDVGRNKHRTRPCLTMSLDSKKWQFKIPQSFIDSKHGDMLAPSLTKGVALQFGLRLDPRWVKTRRRWPTRWTVGSNGPGTWWNSADSSTPTTFAETVRASTQGTCNWFRRSRTRGATQCGSTAKQRGCASHGAAI